MFKIKSKPGLKYFNHSHNYHRFILLKEIKEKGPLLLPIQSDDEEFLNAVSNVHFQSFISEGLIKKNVTDKGTILDLTEAGAQSLKKHFIDYQLDLLVMEKNIDNFYTQLIERLIQEKVRKIALYGASDTSRSLLKYLKNQQIETVCVIDDDPKKQGSEFMGLPIISPAGISEFVIDAIVISTVVYQDNIAEKIKASFGEKYKILTLFK